MTRDEIGFMDRNTELRKVKPACMVGLINLLSDRGNWKKLLEVVPKELDSSDSLKRYSVDHVRLIENYSELHKIEAAEIFLQEWSIAGRNRPKIGHLLKLLIDAQLWRAADFVAVKFLNESPPERPLNGPQARVPIYPLTPTDRIIFNDQFENAPYPSSSRINAEFSIANINLTNESKDSMAPKFTVDDSTRDLSNSDNNARISILTSENNVMSTFSNPIHPPPLTPMAIRQITPNPTLNAVQTATHTLPNFANQQKPLIESNPNPDLLPQLSKLLCANSNEINPNISDLSRQSFNTTASDTFSRPHSDVFSSDSPQSQNYTTHSSDSSEFRPMLSALLSSPENNSLPNDTINQNDKMISSSSELRPMLSALLSSLENNALHSATQNQNDKMISSGSELRPMLSVLLSSPENNFLPSTTINQNDRMISSGVSELRPMLSDLLSSPENNALHSATQNQNDKMISSGSELKPMLSDLLSSPEKNSLPNVALNQNDKMISSDNSELMSDLPSSPENNSLPRINQNDKMLSSGQLEFRPVLSDLLPSESNISSRSHILQAIDFSAEPNQSGIDNMPYLSAFLTSTDNSDSKSTLPSLELKTELPHFSYKDLEFSTNNFNENTYSLDQNSNGRHLGSGAFGSVYLAVGLLDKNVAVKKINLQSEVIQSIDAMAKLFKNEVELLYKYKHTNIVSLLGYSCDGPTFCLVYEHVCSGSLESRLLNDLAVLSWTERLNIGLGTAAGILYLHTAYETPLIHRDIKSANILLTENNTPKLCDFGLVKSTPEKTSNYTSQVCGTSAYMAPEAFRGDVSIKMDTFSFGVVLFELLTSLPPRDENREGKDLITYVEDQCEDEIGDLLDLRAGTWRHNDINYSAKLFDLGKLCIEEKKKRPTMARVHEILKSFFDDINGKV